MNSQAIKTAILTWAARETAIVCIFARQGKPRPNVPYCSLLITNAATRIGGQDEIRVNGEVFKQSGLRNVVISINIFGDGANDKMDALRDSLDRPDVIEEFQLAGLAHHREEGPNDLGELEQTLWLERSQMDLICSYAKNTELTTNPILETDIEGDFYNTSEDQADEDNEIQSVEINVTQ